MKQTDDMDDASPVQATQSTVWNCFDAHSTTEWNAEAGLTIRKKTAKCKFCKANFQVKRGNTSNL